MADHFSFSLRFSLFFFFFFLLRLLKRELVVKVDLEFFWTPASINIRLMAKVVAESSRFDWIGLKPVVPRPEPLVTPGVTALGHH